MSTGRLIKSHRIGSTGIHSHRCPLDGETIDYTPCLTCPQGGPKVVLHQTVSYKVSCGIAVTNRHLMATQKASKAYNPDSLPGKMPLSTVKDTYKWVGLKMDGARALIQINDGENLCVGRRMDSSGSKREWQDNVPHFRDFPFPEDLHETVLDTEIIMQPKNWVGGTVPTGTLGATMKVVGSSPEKAVAVQKEQGNAIFYAFDIMWYKGTDVRHLPYKDRRKLLRLVLDRMISTGFSYVALMPGHPVKRASDIDALLASALLDGHEGLVLKNLNAAYMDRYAMIKLKEVASWDVLVTGFEYGKKGSKWEDQIGAFNVSVIHSLTREYIEVGKVPPGDDATRLEYTKLLCDKTPSEIADLKIVAEVEFQNVTKEFRMRHARIIRFRPDRSEPEVVDFSEVTRK